MNLDLEMIVIINKINQYKQLKVDLNEEDTKRCLIAPFFKLLGYDTENLLEFKGEYILDCREKGSERVDYAIMIDGKPQIIIEAKKFTEDLSMHIGQLQRYYNTDVDIDYGILTNGIKYMFFTDSENINIMDKAPFYTVDLSDLKEDDTQFLNYLRKESISNIENNMKPIDNLIKSKKIQDYIEQQLKNPDESFVKLISDNINVKDLSKEDIVNAIKFCFSPIDRRINTINTIEIKESTTKVVVSEIVNKKEKAENRKLTKKAYKPRINQLFEQGLLKSGDVLYIKTAPDKKAVVVDSKIVNYQGEMLTYNEWGNLVTGWTTICIYEHAVQERTNRLLDSLRKDLK